MNDKIYKIIIIGAGQIGSRHLQALRAVKQPLDITVVDPLQQSLRIAKERYDSMPEGDFKHRLRLVKNQPQNEIFDLALIATCSDIRAKVTKDLLLKNKIRFLVLEKILFNKKKDYVDIAKILNQESIKTWVNCCMRMMPFYKSLKKDFTRQKINYHVSGSGFGLITNTIHYLDHIAHLTGSTKFTINTDGLNKKIKPSKRRGFMELSGTLGATFDNGSVATFTSYYNQSTAPIMVKIISKDVHVIINETLGKAWVAESKNNWGWQEVPAPIPYQSQLTTILVDDLIKKGSCDLPNFQESSIIHLQMLEQLKSFLDKNIKEKYNDYPFT